MSNSPKYYVYLSESKVDMLYGQRQGSFLRRALRGVRKVEFGVGGVNVGVSAQSLNANQYAKLQSVINALEKRGEVGDIDKPGSYFRGTVPLRWGALAPGSATVIFAGETPMTSFLLGGSMRHVIGAQDLRVAYLDPPEWLKTIETAVSSQDASDVARSETAKANYADDARTASLAVKDAATREKRDKEWDAQLVARQERGEVIPPMSAAPPLLSALAQIYLPERRINNLPEALTAIRSAVLLTQGVPYRMDFVAKSLLHGEIGGNNSWLGQLNAAAGKRVLLGSPIYVALADSR